MTDSQELPMQDVGDQTADGTASPREQHWQDWCRRFDAAHQDISLMFHNRAVWRTMLAMWDANPDVARGGFAERWFARCYTTTQLIAIRREADTDSRNNPSSLYRALNGLASDPRIATRARYEDTLRSMEVGDRISQMFDDLAARFDLFAAPGAPFVDSTLVKADLERLADVSAKAATYATKILAHRTDFTETRPRPLPVTGGELDATIDTIGELFRKYYRLRWPGAELAWVTPDAPLGWDEMFETAWKPAGFLTPDSALFGWADEGAVALNLWSAPLRRAGAL